MADLRIEQNERGKFVVINDDTGEHQIFDTRKAAEYFKAGRPDLAAKIDEQEKPRPSSRRDRKQ